MNGILLGLCIQICYREKNLSCAGWRKNVVLLQLSHYGLTPAEMWDWLPPSLCVCVYGICIFSLYLCMECSSCICVCYVFLVSLCGMFSLYLCVECSSCISVWDILPLYVCDGLHVGKKSIQPHVDQIKDMKLNPNIYRLWFQRKLTVGAEVGNEWNFAVRFMDWRESNPYWLECHWKSAFWVVWLRQRL